MKLTKHEKSSENIKIYYLDEYYENSKNEFSENIKKLREMDENSINYFYKILQRLKFKKNFSICVVPSKKINERKSGIRELCIKLQKKLNLDN